jgi:leucyl-tRNA synthetase
VDSTSDRPKFYGLDMFPYPSGAGISVGHCRNYVPLDVACRHKVMQGYNVLHPMGWDAFGQPAENEAIKRGRNPREMVPEYADNYKRQLKLVGVSYDWSREINSSSPDYYHWTQYFFLLLYKRGLAYRANTPINWCPSCKTGLANEEVVNGRCWRCDTPVEKRPMPQWYFKITEYADRLLADLDTIDWPEGIKLMQRDWIGRSEGAEVTFPIAGEGASESIVVYTTRPDTLWGATFMVLAPEHPLVDTLTRPEQAEAVQAYREQAKRETDIERQNAERVKTGVFTGGYAVNPVNGEPIPVWIADYVLMGYGTGAIMAVPAHDERDFAFARKFGLPIVLVYRTSDDQTEEAMTDAIPAGGHMSSFQPGPGAPPGGFPFAGLPNDKSTVGRVIAWLEEHGIGRGRVNYRLRDWLISRQRYWGAPIPMIHCPTCGEVPVPEDQLPVLLPAVERYEPTGTGESPLAAIPEFVNTTCPGCGGPARRETDTMGGFACSSWYFLRFADPNNPAEPFSQEAMKYWLPVDLYAGGAEHAVMHLLYARFWVKVMQDAGLVNFSEPFLRLRNQGMLLALTPVDKASGKALQPWELVGYADEREEWIGRWEREGPFMATRRRTQVEATADEDDVAPEITEVTGVTEVEVDFQWLKMSKSKGNVVTPDEMAEKYGADSLRLYGLFVAPFEDTVQWTDRGIEAAHKYVNRVWRLWTELRPHFRPGWKSELAALQSSSDETERKLRRKLHQTIRKVGDDIENFRFNTAVAAMMEFTNELSAFRNALGTSKPTETQAVLISEILETLPLVLSPITPHSSDEMWERLGYSGSTFKAPWPVFDEEAAREDEMTLVVQINGKVRERLTVPIGTEPQELERLALETEKVRAELYGKQLRKVIVVPGKLVNLVVG